MTLITIVVGNSKYVVIKDGKVVRAAMCCGAIEAYAALKPKRGEKLYIEVAPLPK
jgi:hypothetical protein